MNITKLERCPPTRLYEGIAVSTRGRQYQFYLDPRRDIPARVYRLEQASCSWLRVGVPKHLAIAIKEALSLRKRRRQGTDAETSSPV